LETIKKLKIELESEKAKNRKIEGRNRIVDDGSIHPKLEELRAECGELGHFWGHYFDNDKSPEHGGVRLTTNTDDMKMVLRMVALGEKKINLKEWYFLVLKAKKQEKPNKSFQLGKITRSTLVFGR